MTEATRQTQASSSELSDAERRRRLAMVYRRLIKLAQQNRQSETPADARENRPRCQLESDTIGGKVDES